MRSRETLEQILQARLFLILRRVPMELLESLAQIFSSAGVSLVEVALNSPNALKSIDLLSRRGLLVGAGTALEPGPAREALQAGARYLVSPVWDPFLSRLCLEHDAVSIPGAFTPTEIWQAHQNGADLVKVFPASSLGPDYFQSVRAPLPDLKLVAVGGIRPDNGGEYLRAGAAALGVGSGIFRMEWITGGQLELVGEVLEQLVQVTRHPPDRP